MKDKVTTLEPKFEHKILGGSILEVKQEERNGIPVGVIIGHIATFDIDQGSFGIRDQFMPGAFLKSIHEHKTRNNRPIRLKDLHGRTVGGFPIDTVIEDKIGLFARGEINLQVQQGAELFSMVKAGFISDFSIGFISIDSDIENGLRQIKEASIIEGSAVDEPMNQAAKITAFKSKSPDERGIEMLTLDDVVGFNDLTTRELENHLQEKGFASKNAAKFIASNFQCKAEAPTPEEAKAAEDAKAAEEAAEEKILQEILSEVKELKGHIVPETA